MTSGPDSCTARRRAHPPPTVIARTRRAPLTRLKTRSSLNAKGVVIGVDAELTAPPARGVTIRGLENAGHVAVSQAKSHEHNWRLTGAGSFNDVDEVNRHQCPKCDAVPMIDPGRDSRRPDQSVDRLRRDPKSRAPTRPPMQRGRCDECHRIPKPVSVRRRQSRSARARPRRSECPDER
jgi:hypothetical protein